MKILSEVTPPLLGNLSLNLEYKLDKLTSQVQPNGAMCAMEQKKNEIAINV